MLQEASGSAGHPSYRRYHYGSGPLLVEDGATRRFISTDALGSMTDLTTTGATVASMRKYDAWGQYRNDTAPQANEPKLGFTGHQYDPETGLVYARARYYDPDLGRFLSRDSYEYPIGAAPHLHRYIYGAGRPTVYVDDSGHLIPLIVIGAALIAANWDFWHQQNVNQTASVEDIWNKTSFGEVGVAAAAGGAAALTGIGAGAAAAAGAGALGAGAVGTGIAAGAVGGGVTAGLDSLSGQAIEVGAGRAESINWGKVGKDTAVGVAVGGVLGGVAGKVSSELDKFGKGLADAAAKGLQEGAAEVAGARSAAIVAAEGGGAAGAGAGHGARAVAQVVEAVDAPATATVRAPIPGDASYSGPLPSDSWTLSPKGMGAHMVERVNVGPRPELAPLDTAGTPRYYPAGTPENAGQAHIRLHEATRAAGIKLQGGNPGMPTSELLSRYRVAYGNSNLSGIRGSLRTPKSTTVLGEDLAPDDAFDALMKWLSEQER